MSDKSKYYAKARKKYEAKEFGEAIYWYTRVIAEDGNDAEMFSERGVAYFHMGELDKALADLNSSKELEPENPYRYSSRAYIRDAMGDLEGAIADYEHAIQLDPDDAVAHNNLGMLEEKRGYHAKAKTLFEFADSLDKDAQAAGMSAADLRPKNIQKEKEQNEAKQSLGREIKQVFTNKSTFKEFLKFIGNGFR